MEGSEVGNSGCVVHVGVHGERVIPYHKLLKIRPPFLHTYFEAKVGRGHWLKSICLVHTPPPFVPHNL